MFRVLFMSFPVGSILGIPIRVHVLLVLLIVLIAFNGTLGLPELVTLAALFPILLLHELGHCVVARRFGIGVVDITLWPLGGLARMTHMPESGRAEALIAFAGPAVNFVLAAIALPIWFALRASHAHPGVVEATWLLFLINIALAIFNLIPAFPTDGGRILRALFAAGLDWVRATEYAVIVGRVFAVLIGAGGLALGNWSAPLVAVWLWWMGSNELEAVRERQRMREAQVEESPETSRRIEELLRAEPLDAEAPVRRKRTMSDEEIERLERRHGRLRGYES